MSVTLALNGKSSDPMAGSAVASVVAVRDLSVTFVQRERRVAAVNGVSFDLAPGEILTILGESGSGKSVTLRALMGLLPPHAQAGGTVRIAGHDLLALDPVARAKLRGPVISMIFQEPMSALDPVFTIGEQIAETIVEHEGIDRRQAMKRALELLEMVKSPSAVRRLK